MPDEYLKYVKPNRQPLANVEFRKSVTPEMRQRLNELAAFLPVVPEIRIIHVKERVSKIGHPEAGYGGMWIPSEKIMLLPIGFYDSDFYHEAGHALHPDWSEKQVEAYGDDMARKFKASKKR